MAFTVLDTEFGNVHRIDQYESSIWTDRYNSYGDFELMMNASKKNLSKFPHNYYLHSPDSEHLMIIEDVRIRTDLEGGDHLIVTGRSLESILDRHSILTPVILNGNLQDAIETLLNENVIFPGEENRRINNFVFEESDDPMITELTIEGQYVGKTLYEVIQTICESHKIGFKITLNEDNMFVFKLYAGADRSYSQTAIPYVIFSPTFRNILNTDYLMSVQAEKNVAIVVGETATLIVTLDDVEPSGLNRKELYVDATDISKEIDGQTISNAEYQNLLIQRGKEALTENKKIAAFEGEVDANGRFKYGRDFFMGDIVQLTSAYDIDSRSRVTEMIMSQDKEGIKKYPTFVVEDN